MRTTSRTLVVAAVAALVSSLSVTVTATPAQAAAVRAKQVRTSSSFAMPAPGLRTVQGLTLGAGSWTVVARAFAVQVSGGGDIVRCQLYDATHARALDASAVAVSPNYPGSVVTDVADVVVPTGGSAVVRQRCGHDGSGGNAAYLDPGATLLAFQARTAAGNRLARTTAGTPLTSTFRTVTSLGLSTGTWLVGVKATAVNFGTARPGRVLCRVEQASTQRYVSGVPGRTAVAGLSLLSTVTTGSSRSIVLSCADTSDAGAYLDPDAVLWARKVGLAATGNSCATLPAAGGDLVIDDHQSAGASGAQCPIGAGPAASQTGGATVGAGTWVVLGGEPDLGATGGGPAGDWFRCGARDVTHSRSLDAGATAWVDNAEAQAQTVYAGLLITTTAATVEWRCGHDDAANTGIAFRSSHVLLKP